MPTWLSYTLITILISLPFYWHVWRRGGAAAQGFPARLRRMLWLPAIAAFGFRFTLGIGFRDVRYGAGPPGLLLLAILLPLVIEVLLIGLATGLGWAAISPRLIDFRDGQAYISEDLDLLWAEERQSMSRFAVNLVLTITFGAVYGALFTLGSEFGWRAFLLPQAAGALGVVGGVLVTGLAWAAWYAPLVLMGYRFPRHPRLGAAVLMPILATALTAVAGWLYASAGTLWAPTLLYAGVLATGALSRLGLGSQGDSLRVQALGLALWTAVALLALSVWPA